MKVETAMRAMYTTFIGGILVSCLVGGINNEAGAALLGLTFIGICVTGLLVIWAKD